MADTMTGRPLACTCAFILIISVYMFTPTAAKMRETIAKVDDCSSLNSTVADFYEVFVDSVTVRSLVDCVKDCAFVTYHPRKKCVAGIYWVGSEEVQCRLMQLVPDLKGKTSGLNLNVADLIQLSLGPGHTMPPKIGQMFAGVDVKSTQCKFARIPAVQKPAQQVDPFDLEF